MPDADSLFAPPTERWQHLSPRYRTVKLIGILIGWPIFIAVTAIPAWFVAGEADGWWLFWLVLAGGVALFLWRLIRLPRWVRRWGYAERDDDVYITHGLMFRHLTCVPYGRMQLVEVSAGPIERMFGLASVEMVTASSSGSVSIPGLAKEDAEAVRDRFINRGQHLRAGI